MVNYSTTASRTLLSGYSHSQAKNRCFKYRFKNCLLIFEDDAINFKNICEFLSEFYVSMHIGAEFKNCYWKHAPKVRLPQVRSACQAAQAHQAYQPVIIKILR